jgi:hypothetical protein
VPYRNEIVETDIGKVERKIWYDPPPPPYVEPFELELERRMNDGTLNDESEIVEPRNDESPDDSAYALNSSTAPVPDSSGVQTGDKNPHTPEEQRVENNSKSEVLYNTKDRPAHIQRAIQQANTPAIDKDGVYIEDAGQRGLVTKGPLDKDSEGRTIGPGGRVVGRPPIVPGTPEWDANAGMRHAAFELFMRGKRVSVIADELKLGNAIVKRRIEEAIAELNTYPDHESLIKDKRNFAVERIKMIQKLALERFDTSPKTGRDAGIGARYLDVLLRAEELRTRIEGTTDEAIPIDEGTKGGAAQTRRIIVVRTDGPGTVSIAEATGVRDDQGATVSVDGRDRVREKSERGVQGVPVRSGAPT